MWEWGDLTDFKTCQVFFFCGIKSPPTSEFLNLLLLKICSKTLIICFLKGFN